MDRIDLHIEVSPVPFDQLSEKITGESSTTIRQRVTAARNVQALRFKDTALHYNSQMGPKEIQTYCVLDKESLLLLENAMKKLSLSARAYDRILKVARTIADLEEKNNLTQEHIAEAIQYRSLDREGWMG